MRRWRCPECRGVHTTRPLDFPAGSAYPARLRIESLKTKLDGGSFRPDISRQVQQYWKRAFDFCLRREENWPAGKDFLKEQVVSGRRPISFCLKYHVIPSGLDPPYLDFAVTRGITSIHLR